MVTLQDLTHRKKLWTTIIESCIYWWEMNIQKRWFNIIVFIQKWLFKTYFLFSQHCFFLPVPPNLTISLQDLQSPQSACWHTSHTPHRFLRGAVASLPSIWSLKKMSNMCRTRGVVVAWIKLNKIVIKCIQDVTFSTQCVSRTLGFKACTCWCHSYERVDFHTPDTCT